MDIQHNQSGNNGSFFVETDNRLLAKMVYSINDPAVVVIEHTEVDPSLRGKNIGLQLVNKAVSFAREHQLKIKANCSFAKKIFVKHPEEYKGILL